MSVQSPDQCVKRAAVYFVDCLQMTATKRKDNNLSRIHWHMTVESNILTSVGKYNPGVIRIKSEKQGREVPNPPRCPRAHEQEQLPSTLRSSTPSPEHFHLVVQYQINAFNKCLEVSIRYEVELLCPFNIDVHHFIVSFLTYMLSSWSRNKIFRGVFMMNASERLGFG